MSDPLTLLRKLERRQLLLSLVQVAMLGAVTAALYSRPSATTIVCFVMVAVASVYVWINWWRMRSRNRALERHEPPTYRL